MKIITISREYGAGGHSIGRAVAEKLGIEFYDKDILRETARVSGMDMGHLAKAEEEIATRERFVRSLMPTTYLDEKDSLYSIQRAVLAGLAKKGPCVILGRCADVLLPEVDIETLDVFIYADQLHRAARVGEMLQTNNIGEIQRNMRKHEKARRNYYEYFTGKTWGDSRNYNLCLDSGTLGYDLCVELICAAAKAE